MHTSRAVVVLGAAVVAAGLTATTPAGAAGPGTSAVWLMDESSGSTMYDSDLSDGIASNGTLRNVTPTGSGYVFNGGSSLVAVPPATSSSDEFDPGSSPVTMRAEVRIAAPPSQSVGDFDVLRGPAKGAYKIEIVARNNRTTAKALCFFKGTQTKAQVVGGPNLADGSWHSIMCAKTSSTVSLTVDGTTLTKSVSVGSLSNPTGLSLGGKDYGSGGDWFKGTMRNVSVRIG